MAENRKSGDSFVGVDGVVKRFDASWSAFPLYTRQIRPPTPLQKLDLPL